MVQWTGGLDSRLVVRSAVCLEVHLTRRSVSDVSVAVHVQQRIQVNLIQKQDPSACMSTRPAVCLPKVSSEVTARTMREESFAVSKCVRAHFCQTLILLYSASTLRVADPGHVSVEELRILLTYFSLMILSLIAMSKSSVTECSRSPGRASGPIMSTETLKY